MKLAKLTVSGYVTHISRVAGHYITEDIERHFVNYGYTSKIALNLDQDVEMEELTLPMFEFKIVDSWPKFFPKFMRVPFFASPKIEKNKLREKRLTRIEIKKPWLPNETYYVDESIDDIKKQVG